jgi:ABC-type branched-subunit amino acid transport system permease subunit
MQVASILVNSLSAAMTIFLAASGLTLLFGILRLLNFAHGSFIMIGAYLAYTLIGGVDLSVATFIGVAFVSGLVVAALGYPIDKFILARMRKIDSHYVLIATFALMLVCNGVVKLIWGLDYVTVSPPSFLDQPVQIGSLFISRYSLFLILAGLAVYVALEFTINRLWLGKLMQALQSDAWMSGLLGLNVPLGLTLSVMAGFFLAGLGGGLLLPNQSLSSHMGDAYILSAFFAVIIGGLGNIRGALIASVMLGLANVINSTYLPSYPGTLLYALLAIFLLVMPNGLYPGLANTGDSEVHEGHGMVASMISRRRWQIVGLVVAVVFYLVPLWAGGGVLFLAGTAVIHGLFALSWNLLFGYAGLAAFGHAAFFGLGAYLTGALLRFYPEVPFLSAVLASGIVGIVLAWLVGELALRRLSGIFLAILTLSLGEMVRLLISYNPHLGGEDGLVSIPRPKLTFPVEIDLTGSANYYWFLLSVTCALIALLWWFVHSRFGRVLLAIRQDAERASFIGIDVPRARIMALMISGGVAAIAGSLYAPWVRIVTLDELGWLTSVQPVLNSMLGGVNSFWGPLLGAVVFTIINYGTRTMAGLSELIIGVMLLAIILAAPNGIVGLLRALEPKILGRRREPSKLAKNVEAPPAVQSATVTKEAGA